MNLTLRVANYMSRYAPSRARIETYLEKKKCQDIGAFLSEISYDESLMISMWMRTFLSLGKGRCDIEMKLRQKWFPKELIRESLEIAGEEIEDWEMMKSSILRQIDTLRDRGKSVRVISMTLISKYPYFREQICTTLESDDDSETLEKEMQKYKNRYNLEDTKDREKLIAALVRKGFEYREIRKKLVTSD